MGNCLWTVNDWKIVERILSLLWSKRSECHRKCNSDVDITRIFNDGTFFCHFKGKGVVSSFRFTVGRFVPLVIHQTYVR